MPGFEAPETDSAQVVDLPRGPGRPTGEKKTGGRKKGSKNRRTVEVEMFLRPALPKAKARIKALLDSEDQELALKAASLVLGYVFGKPRERRELSGPDGGAIETRATQILEASQRVSEAFTEVADTTDPGEVMTDESLGAVQAVNFLLAQREAAEHAQNSVRTSTPAVADDAAPEPSPQPEAPAPEPEAQGDPEAPPEGHTLSFVEGTLCIVGCPPCREGLPPIYEVRTVGGSMVRRANFDKALELVKRHSGADLGRWVLQEPRPEPGVSRHDQLAAPQPIRPAVHRHRPRT